MRRKLYASAFVALLFASISGAVSGQCPGCLINAGCIVTPAAPTICPDTLPIGTAMAPYSEDISFYLPAEFVDDGSGFNVTLVEMTVLSVSGLPYGLSWETNAPNNIYYPSSNPPATEHGCAKICGTPFMAGSYTVTVFVQAEVDVSGIGQTVNDFFTIPLTILPASSTNGSFSINNPFGCEPHSTGFINNLPSNSLPGYSYLWSFGNGNQSTLENPPLQSYLSAGIYTVSLHTIIDTIGYFLSGVTVLTATGCNDSPFSSPDYYFILKQGGNTVFTSTYVDETDPPVSITFTQIALSNQTYDLEIWEYDTGLAGDDDHCGTVSFNGFDAGSHTLTSGSLVTTVVIDHPVIVIDASDTVEVYPSATVSAVAYQPGDSICQSDSVMLSVQAAGAAGYQWYSDTAAIFNAIDSVYFATQTGNYHCEVMNSYGCRTNSNVQHIVVMSNPPKPTFWITTNLLNTNLAGYSLQWFYDGAPLAGETGMTCPVANSGNYFLIASNPFGCYTSSDTVYVEYYHVASEEWPDAGISIQPNPSNGEFILGASLKVPARLSVEVTDPTGRCIYSIDFGVRSGSVSEPVRIPGLSAGLYMMKVKIDGYQDLRRLLIY